MKQIWFWQLILSPHMVMLASKMCDYGIEVHYVIDELMSTERSIMGWEVDVPTGIHLHILEKGNFFPLLNKISHDDDVTHIVQGIRGNGYISQLMPSLIERKHKFWIIMETVDLRGWKKLPKIYEYKRLFKKYDDYILGVLAIGHKTKNWLESVGVNSDKIFPFAYFLKSNAISDIIDIHMNNDSFHVIYCGNLIERKRVDWVIDACSQVNKMRDINIDFWVIGDGKLKNILVEYAKLKNLNTHWFGKVQMSKVRGYISQADCLILPSSHDGWGAVVSEALMEGIPVICSDACGVAEVVLSSKDGGVFEKNNMQQLVKLLLNQVKKGKITDEKRNELKTWAKKLSDVQGAQYLYTILYKDNSTNSVPPWKE